MQPLIARQELVNLIINQCQLEQGWNVNDAQAQKEFEQSLCPVLGCWYRSSQSGSNLHGSCNEFTFGRCHKRRICWQREWRWFSLEKCSLDEIRCLHAWFCHRTYRQITIVLRWQARSLPHSGGNVSILYGIRSSEGTSGEAFLGFDGKTTSGTRGQKFRLLSTSDLSSWTADWNRDGCHSDQCHAWFPVFIHWMFDVRTAPTISKVSWFSHRGRERRTRQRLSTEVQHTLERSSSWLFLSSRLRYLYRGASSYTTQLKTALSGKVDGDEQNEQVGWHEGIFCSSIRSFLLEENTFDCLQDLLECSNYDPWLVSLTTFVQVECHSLVEANGSYFERVRSSSVSVCLGRTEAFYFGNRGWSKSEQERSGCPNGQHCCSVGISGRCQQTCSTREASLQAAHEQPTGGPEESSWWLSALLREKKMIFLRWKPRTPCCICVFLQ